MEFNDFLKVFVILQWPRETTSLLEAQKRNDLLLFLEIKQLDNGNSNIKKKKTSNFLIKFCISITLREGSFTVLDKKYPQISLM